MLSALPPSLLTTITSLSYLNLLTFLLGAHLITNVLRVLYRLSPWHPLAKYPGPVMAKATYWYRTYHEIYRGGKMTKELFILHEKYGDVVRFGPNDVCAASLCSFPSLIYPLTITAPFPHPQRLPPDLLQPQDS